MLIINADDWGRSERETDVALACFNRGRITSATAMVFMQDSERSSRLANDASLPLGLHLNLSQMYNGPVSPVREALRAHQKVVRFMTLSRYAMYLYNPLLRSALRTVFTSQLTEFTNSHGRSPSHVDGHQHRHHCTNMLLEEVISPGLKVRRTFSYFPGERGALNRAYRKTIDALLRKRYISADYFFSLKECLQGQSVDRVFELAKSSNVELMTHPVVQKEYDWLLSDECGDRMAAVSTGSYATLLVPAAPSLATGTVAGCKAF
jgi:predicted glycoside hydrolase/deacetylase ChbG (UPF0249 family)